VEQPEHISVPMRGYQIAVHKWPGKGSTILFCHATGFHGRIWDQVISKLGAHNCVSIDLRGHGDSDKTDTLYDWDTFVPDVQEVISHLNIDNLIGVGHSMGGHVITKVAISDPKTVRGLVLCDPSIFDAKRYRAFDVSQKKEHPVSRRRNIWKDPQEMFDRLKTHKNFAAWEHNVLMDYCTYGLRLSEYGSHFELKCPPSVEAKMYGAYIDPAILEELPTYTNPVQIMLARSKTSNEKLMDLGPSITRPDLHHLLPNAVSERFDSLSHFLPMENPNIVADVVKDMSTSIF